MDAGWLWCGPVALERRALLLRQPVRQVHGRIEPDGREQLVIARLRRSRRRWRWRRCTGAADVVGQAAEALRPQHYGAVNEMVW